MLPFALPSVGMKQGCNSICSNPGASSRGTTPRRGTNTNRLPIAVVVAYAHPRRIVFPHIDILSAPNMAEYDVGAFGGRFPALVADCNRFAVDTQAKQNLRCITPKRTVKIPRSLEGFVKKSISRNGSEHVDMRANISHENSRLHTI